MSTTPKRCYFIPHRISDEQQSNITIHNEKLLLDEFLELGLMAQKFERTTLNLKGADGINTEQMTLKDLVQHGQGLAKQGSGAGTRSVLKETGLLLPCFNSAN